MMATTHALFGVALAAVTLFFAPEYSSVAVAAAVAGGFFPDLDLYAGHRKTLHFPVYYSLLAPVALAVAAVFPGVETVALAFFLLAAATHSVMDALGGGLELKPWQGTSERAVYDHFRGRWVRPRRWVRYDGAPEDLALALALGVPALALFEGPITVVVSVILAVSAVYALLRKPLVAIAEWLVAWLPADVLAYVPERFVDVDELA